MTYTSMTGGARKLHFDNGGSQLLIHIDDGGSEVSINA